MIVNSDYTKPKIAGINISFMLMIYLVISLLGQGVFYFLKITSGLCYTVVNALFAPVSILISIFFLKQKDSFCETVAIKKTSLIWFIAGAFLGIGLILAFGFINPMIKELVEKLGGKTSSIDLYLDNVWEYLLFVLILAVLPAVTEEFLYRGILINGLGKAKVLGAVLTSAVCFTLYHGSITQFVFQFIYGVSLAFLFVRAKSVLPCILAHFLNNFFTLTASFLNWDINLNNPLVIIIGLCIATFSYLILIFYKRKDIVENNKDKESNKKILFDFWVPFGLFSCGIGVLFIILGVL